MGLFDFFKKKEKQNIQVDSTERKISKKELDDLVLHALNVLCDDVSTIEDAKKLIQSKGYNERQTGIIVNRANELYLRHFKGKMEISETTNQADKEKSSEIEIISDEQGSHGDNFGGLLGFNYLNSGKR